jgi:hypothetical protein
MIDEVTATLLEEPFVSAARVEDVDSANSKVIQISEGVKVALKRAERGSDPLSIINRSGVLRYSGLLSPSFFVCSLINVVISCMICVRRCCDHRGGESIL